MFGLKSHLEVNRSFGIDVASSRGGNYREPFFGES